MSIYFFVLSILKINIEKKLNFNIIYYTLIYNLLLEMTQNDNIKQNEELKELEKDLWLDSNDNDNEFIENDDNIDSELDENQNDEISKLKELLARTQADYNNFKMRSERDRQDMIFLKIWYFKKILPRVDDLERIIKNTKMKKNKHNLWSSFGNA